MKVLVTGGAGFIASNFVHYWRKHNPQDAVRIIDNYSYGSSQENLKGLEGTIEVLVGDIRKREDVSKAMKGIDTVVHFAAESHVDHSIEGATNFVTTNVLGTQVLLEEAQRSGVQRFHYVSTDEVFGHLPNGGKFIEESKIQPRNPYAATKAAGEHLVRAHHNTHGLFTTISNCSNNYGPRQATDKLVPKAIQYALEGRSFPLYAGGHQVRDWLHVDDHCSALELILKNAKPGASYVLGGDCELENKNLVERIYWRVGQKPLIDTVEDRKGHDQRYAVDHSRITRELGWKPKKTLQEGLQETIDWYVERLR